MMTETDELTLARKAAKGDTIYVEPKHEEGAE